MPKTEGQFILFTKDEFKNYLLNTSFHRNIYRIQNHHTYIPNYTHFFKDSPPNHFKWLNSMKRSHLQRGFSDIGQNLTTFPDGTVALCRTMERIPAAIKGANTGSVAIEHLGYFDTGENNMTEAHKEIIVFTNAMLCHKFNLSPNDQNILYHHWFDLNSGKPTNGSGSTKSCPGTDFFGGNTVEAANKNFIPLITEKISNIITNSNTPPVQSLLSGKVTASKLNVRAGVGTNFKVLYQLSHNAIVTVYAELDNWYKINPKENQWVAKQFIALDN